MVNKMTEKYNDADAIVTIEGREYALYKNGPLKKYPYMIDTSTGAIPQGEQRSLLRTYLLLHGIDIEPWGERVSHWCVRQAIKVAQSATGTVAKTSKAEQNKVHKNIPIMTADAAVQLIRDYFNETVKDPHGRYMSWRHCYKAFSENRNAADEQAIDYLSLHLAFYLASWGMYRGSSFLLQKDYKVHIPIVMIIQEQKYNPLHGISAEDLCEKENLDLLNEIAMRIRDCYAKEQPSVDGITNNATDTLVTKILLGTLGCVPAFDRYYVNSVKKNHVSTGVFNKNSVRNVAEFYCDNLDAFENLRHELSKCGIEYPPMKLMDMCFWQDAYIDDLKDGKHHLDEVLEVEG